MMGAQDYVSGQKLGTTSKAVYDLGDPLGLMKPIDGTKREEEKEIQIERRWFRNKLMQIDKN